MIPLLVTFISQSDIGESLASSYECSLCSKFAGVGLKLSIAEDISTDPACTVHLFISHVTAANGQKARPCSTERSPPRQNCGLRKLGNKIGTNRDGGREWRNLNAACGEEKSKEGERIADLAACGDEGLMKLS